MECVTKTINELCLKITDGAHNSPEEDVNGAYPMYSSKDMLYDCFDTENTKMISNENYHKLVKQDCRPLQNDILIIKDGNSYLKYAFRVKEDLEAVILSSIAILRPNIDEINPDFFVYLLRTNSIRNAMANYVSGAAIPRIVLKDFKKMKLQFEADKHIQAEIARILLEYDNLITNNTKRIKILEQMAENLYKEWFVRFRFPCHEDVEFIAGEPQAWKLTKLEEIITIDRGLSYSSEEIDCDEGIDLVNLKNIQAFGGFRVDGTKKYSGKFKEQQIVKRGDLVMGVTDMTQDRRTVGAVALIPVIHNTSVISADLIKITSKLNNVFMYCMFKYGGVSRYISQFANGANVLHLRPQVVSAVKVFLPTENLIEGFSEIVQPIIDEIDLLNEKNDNLVKQRDLLLPRLMSGKLEVK